VEHPSQRACPTFRSMVLGESVTQTGWEAPCSAFRSRCEQEASPRWGGGARDVRGLLPKERGALDLQREAEPPDRPAAARADAILLRPVEDLTVEQPDHRPLFGVCGYFHHKLSIGKGNSRCNSDTCLPMCL
jgi:hypothetical protein